MAALVKAELLLVEPCIFDSNVVKLLPLICFSRELVSPKGAGVFAVEDVGEDDDELIDVA